MYIEINKHIMRNKIRESRHSAHMDVLIFYGIVPKTTKSFIYGKIKDPSLNIYVVVLRLQFCDDNILLNRF